MTAILDAAIEYATTNNWSVFPAPPGTKKSYKSARHSGGSKWGMTRDAAAIREDWTRWPEANVGIPTGAVNGFFVIEADTPVGHGVDGIASMQGLQDLHGRLPSTRMAMSPSGSTHWYFRHPGSSIKIMNSASTIAPGVDVRGDGGMVIAPPSVRNDGSYVWLNDEDIAEAPEWLIEKATAPMRSRANGQDRSAAALQEIDYAKIDAALDAIPNADLGWEEWNRVAMTVFVGTSGSTEGLEAFRRWSEKSAKHDDAKTDERWEKLRSCPPTDISVGTLFFLASQANPGWDRKTVDDFYAYAEMNNYIVKWSGAMWSAVAVDLRVPPVVVQGPDGEPKRIKPHVWLSANRSVDKVAWCPGHPLIIKNKYLDDDGFHDKYGSDIYNQYRAPVIAAGGDATRAGPWLDLCDKVLGAAGRKHCVAWFAHRVQHPDQKINHALVIGGEQGIGKDTLLVPVRHAIGAQNFKDISPHHVVSKYNSYVKSVIVRINEARDLGELNRYDFYEFIKNLLCSPPEGIMVNEKHIREYWVANITSAIITTNHKTDGMFIPKGDRRHYVMWSDLTPDDFADGYWNEINGWYDSGGLEHVQAYLANYDITGWDPKANPPKTRAWQDIVEANNPSENDEMADAIDRLGRPAALIVEELITRSEFSGDCDTWLQDRKNRRAIPHRLEQCGYDRVGNPEASDGIWRINGRRLPVYARNQQSDREKLAAARALKERLERAS